MNMSQIRAWIGGKPHGGNVYDLCAHLAERGEGAKPLDLTAHLKPRQNHEMVSSTCVRLKRKAHNLRVVS